MFDPTARQDLIERLGPGSAHVDPDERERIVNKIGPDTEATYDTLWSAWINLSLTLMAFGFTHRTLCDGAGEMAAAVSEYEAKQEAAHTT